ncbi:MAG: hypothetical protein A2845_04945 [Candidatus Lloydbacteria bacterium RIFCSPHIGHO2_01_FULL_49_22]|uniref:Uncharacterized protein n=1 Tax=Candidatus Lloydbacteria bacterium RIFCSPHIGHO2_01_FULL_49_22 TaxID=1798658 RepID=A0A1G2CWE2_9BACT|nr:MAG: hypothetical protein A2845_04945 [Candidatus Lloydbacteria bacterium RIFCSPHIGHO2_01_FULL_49_22]OGZ10158.1 MAG: hypothetical protein A3C14_00980 [Candidatus Lloydbacteria bacterium RIFCSPHIGHO2_02_FULL_50_18]
MRSLLVFVLSAIAATALLSQKRTLSTTAYLDTPEMAQLRSTLDGLYSDLQELEALHKKMAADDVDPRYFQPRIPTPIKYLH